MKISRPRFSLILSALTAGLVIAVLDAVFEISLAALLFTGPLAEYLPAGVGLILFGAFTMLTLVALTSSMPGMIAVPQDSAVAVLALVSAAILAAMPASASNEEKFSTVIIAVILTSLLTGLFFLVLGQLKLGRLVRYVPYPVIGGFLAGTGWVIASGALSVLTGAPLTLAGLPSLLQADMLVLWLPALIFALLLLFALRRSHGPLVIPVMLLAAGGLFYAWLGLAGVSIAEAQSRGWLLGTMPGQVLWQPYLLSALPQANWSAIASQALQMTSILIVSVLALLFNVSGLETTIRRDIDLDRELRSAGLANLVAGLGGSPVGYQALSLSTLSQRMSVSSRLVGLFTAAFVGLFILLGGQILSFMPVMVLGGLLFFLGLSFLVEWVYDAWFTLPRSDYVLVLLILVIIGAIGFLQGVAAGILIALVLFVFNYSRINIVKHTLSGDHYRSTIVRPDAQRQYLREHGAQILILELQGFIFFGTAYSLLRALQERLKASELPVLRSVVLDFRLVNGIDSSVASSFVRLKQLAESESFQVVITGMPAAMQAKLQKAGASSLDGGIMSFQPTLDHGVEYSENCLLEEADLAGDNPPGDLRLQLEKILPSREAVSRLLGYLEKCEFSPGGTVMRQGDPSDCLYLIECGIVSVQIDMQDGESFRVRTLQSGNVVGEIGLYLEQPRTASIVAIKPSTLYRLSDGAFREMQEKEPEIAAALHRWIVAMLAERLSDNAATLRALFG